MGHHVTSYIQGMTLTDYVSQEKREEEYVPVLKTALMHKNNDSKITRKGAEKN